jgi:crotonobetaine/carnitine-CoA ligase
MELLERWEDKTPDKPFVGFGGEWRSYREVAESSRRLAAGLLQLGVCPGTRVAVLLPNRSEFITIIFACGYAGAVQVPLNTSLKGDFLRHQLGHSKVSALITDALGLAQVRELLEELSELKDIVLVGPGDPAVIEAFPRPITLFESVSARAELASPDLPLVTPKDLSAILYTSGTTGMPKGCLIPHRYRAHAGLMISGTGVFRTDDVAFTTWPLFHMGGQVSALGPVLAVGGTIAYEEVFSASRFMAQAREVGATVICGMGMMAMAVLAQPASDHDRYHSIRQAWFTPLAPEDHQRFQERFSIPVFSELFGQTEFNPSAYSAVGGPSRPGSAGRRLPNIEYRIVDDDDNEVEDGAIGEVVLRPNRPDMMFAGYWNDPEGTLATFQNLWHHTGDSGRFDADGFLYFVDRKKDAIKRRGELVSSRELERAILKHSGVSAVTALAVPSDVTEDDIKVCIVPEEATELTPQDLFDFFRDELPYFAIPRYVELHSELPMNASQRVLKHKLRESNGATWDLEAMGLVVPRDERRSTSARRG